MPTEKTKQCFICKLELLLTVDYFYRDSSCKDGFSGKCKDCHNKQCAKWQKEHPEKAREKAKKWRIANPEKIREKNQKQRMRAYGLALEEFNVACELQENCCYVCHQKIIPLHVDHDHKSNKIRGLLCNSCNHLLGFAKDDISILRKAIKYLENPPGVPCRAEGPNNGRK